MKLLSIRRALLVLLAIGYGCLIAGESVSAAEPAAANITSQSPAVEPAPPLSQRFAEEGVKETPDFQKHVVPLLGRLGCNGRACHGSFQGRGGFQLSLFGYDFKGDHEALLDDASGRVDVDDIEESLIISKPTDADMHEGGKRYATDSWQHHVLRRWIEGGAEFGGDQLQSLVRLEVTPSEVLFTDEGEQLALTAIAHWKDGTAEDVTELCRFSSNDDSIAEIDENGEITAGVRGDTHVVAFYDNAVVPVPVMRPVAAAGHQQPIGAPSQPIDQLVQAKLDKLGILPSGICTDAEFIRRVSLDITGILPDGDSVRKFLADDSSDKRQQLIDQLLESPGYSAWWATRFSDWTGNSEEQLNNVFPIRNAASRLWYEWLRTRIDANMPYDQIVEGIVTANSRQPDESYTEFCESMTKACTPGNENLFAERDGLPMYWARRNFQKPEERAIGFAYAFLGVRIECAQCHKHPFDQWSKDDFEQFSQLFTPIRVNQNQVAPEAKQERERMLEELTGGKKLKGGDLRRAVYKAAQEGKTVPFGELLVNTRAVSERAMKARAAAKKKGRKVPPLNIPSGKILGQPQDLVLDKDPRGELMQWLRSPQNPYFAKAVVNRLWSNYFGVGIVDPTDDMNLANPPSNAPLLDHLATAFVENDFDLQWLHREIVSSQAYQRSAETNDTNVADRSNFSHHIPRRLPAEVVYDSIALATGSDSSTSRLRDDLDKMAIAEGVPRGRNSQNFLLKVFGQSARESNCDCDRSDSPSLLQSIYLRNDAEIHRRLADKDGWVAQACQELGVQGPESQANSQQLAVRRKAEGVRKQFVNRIRQFNKQPQDRQRKMRSQVNREYGRTADRIKQMGFDVPPLASLFDDINAWSELEAKAKDVAASKTLEDLVEDAYLRTLSRFPDQQEREASISFIEESETPASGVQSLMWALVNTKEFIISH
jgi:hypothetical protein